MTSTKNSSTVQSMFASIAQRYDLTNRVLSFGCDLIWRRKLVRLVSRRAGQVAMDLCTGTGDLVPKLQKLFPKVLAVDFCLPMLVLGKNKVKQAGPDRLRLIQADALRLPVAENSLDVITVAFGVRNFENLGVGLKECFRALKSGGTLYVLEFGQPQGLFGVLYRWYSRHVMPLIGGLLTGNRAAYSYLPQTAAQFPCGKVFGAELEKCGFRSERIESLSGGIAYIYCALK